MNPTDAVNVLKFLERQVEADFGSPESKASLQRVADHLKDQVRRLTSDFGDGGPAYPQHAVYDPMREQVNAAYDYGAEAGLSVRDFFAAKAMQSVFTVPIESTAEGKAYIATHAYKMADAMLKERAR